MTIYNVVAKTYDIGIILSKSRDTVWDILPDEICEIIYHYYTVARRDLLKSYLHEISDKDLYAELRHRNRNCFSAFDVSRTEMYNKTMDDIGVLETVGESAALIYSANEIDYANEIVNMTIRNNHNIPEMITRIDYYTINDMYDAINSHSAIYNIDAAVPGTNVVASQIRNALVVWNAMNGCEKMNFCSLNFHKIKDDFVKIEQMVTNSQRFNSLRMCCEMNLHRYMGL